MSTSSAPLCVQCGAQPAIHLNPLGRGPCAACFDRFLTIDRSRPPENREEIAARLDRWGLPQESVTLDWHVDAGEEWVKSWAGYYVEWWCMTPHRASMLHCVIETCDYSGEPRQIIQWRLWHPDTPGFVEHHLEQDGSGWRWRLLADATDDRVPEAHLATLVRLLRRQTSRGKPLGKRAILWPDFCQQVQAICDDWRAKYEKGTSPDMGTVVTQVIPQVSLRAVQSWLQKDGPVRLNDGTTWPPH